jgi:cell division initiation protein
MEVTPKTLREVEFREKMRGYHPEDVDHFLEQVAAGIEVLQDRLRQAVERAQRAETAAAEAGGADDTLRKTLILAQRTADLAVQEAREQAARILASAEQQAQAILAEAEEKGRRTLEETIAECRAELTRLEGVRAQSQHEVDSLQRWLDEHKAHLTEVLTEAITAVDRAGIMWPAPSTLPIDVPSRGPAAVAAAPVAAAPEVADPETVMWSPPDNDRLEPADIDAGSPPAPEMDLGDPDPDEQALDDFFDDNDEMADDRRFGGRLRRRR